MGCGGGGGLSRLVDTDASATPAPPAGPVSATPATRLAAAAAPSSAMVIRRIIVATPCCARPARALVVTGRPFVSPGRGIVLSIEYLTAGPQENVHSASNTKNG